VCCFQIVPGICQLLFQCGMVIILTEKENIFIIPKLPFFPSHMCLFPSMYFAPVLIPIPHFHSPSTRCNLLPMNRQSVSGNLSHQVSCSPNQPMGLGTPSQPWFSLSLSISSCSDKDTRFPVLIWFMPSTAHIVENAQQLPSITEKE
jgi:hypothetical protein